MSSLAFVTHKFVTDLTKAGLDTGMAEVLANHYASLMDDRIATKDDIEFLCKDIESMEERLNTRIIGAQLESIVAICAMLGSLMVILQG